MWKNERLTASSWTADRRRAGGGGDLAGAGKEAASWVATATHPLSSIP